MKKKKIEADSINIFRKRKEEKKWKERTAIFNKTADAMFSVGSDAQKKRTKVSHTKKKVERIVNGVDFIVDPVERQTDLFDFFDIKF